MRRLKLFVQVNLLLVLLCIQRSSPPIRHDTEQNVVSHYGINYVCRKLVYLPEAPPHSWLTTAMRNLGLRSQPHRQSLTFRDGAFYPTPELKTGVPSEMLRK